MADSISRHGKSLQELVGYKVNILIKKPPTEVTELYKRYPVIAYRIPFIFLIKIEIIGSNCNPILTSHMMLLRYW